MNNKPWILRFALCVGFLFGAAACTDDQLVRGPQAACIGDGCQNDVSTTDTSGDADVQLTRSVNFHVETAKGNLLEGTTTSASLGLADDKYPDIGVQVDVVVAAQNVPDGTPVSLLINGKDSGVTSTIAKGAARLDKITLPCTGAPIVLTVSAAVVGEAKVEAGKTLVLDCGGACTASIEPPPSCLIADGNAAVAGFQYTFIVKTTTPDCTHAFITFVDAQGKKGQSVKVALGGASSAPVEVTLSADATGLVGEIAKVTAVVEDESHPDRLPGQSAELPVVLTTEAPIITIAQPLPGQITLGDDTDAKTDGVQLPLVGTATTMTPADTSAVKLFINGVPAGDATPKVDSSFQFPLSFTQSATYSVKILATNSCGLSSSVTVPYSVFVSKASMLIQDPAPGQVLLAKNDGDPTTTTVYDAAFLVSLQQPTQDSDISIYCKKAGLGNSYLPDAVGKATVTDASAATLAVPVTLDVDVLGNDVVCFARDNAPNPSQSAEVAFKIGLPAPCLSVVLPPSSVTVAASGLQVAVVGSNLDGVPIKARLTSQSGTAYPEVTVGTMQKGSLVAKLPLSFGNPPAQLPDGVYKLTLEATDTWGNLASESACSDVVRTVTIDTQGPTLVVTLPAKATLTAVDDPDTQPNTPGYQTDVAIQATDAATVCLSVNGASLGCQPGTPGVTTVQFPGVTLQPGANYLAPTGADALGNASAPPPTLVTLVSDVPIVQFVTPPGSVATVFDAMEVTVKVTDPQSGAPIGNALLEVRIDGAIDAAVVVTPGNDGAYSFSVSGLSVASKSVQVGAAQPATPAKLGYSSVIQLSYKTDKPGIEVTAPADGSMFNLGSLACVPGVPGCITDVIATTVHTADGSSATLTVNCAGTPTQYPGQVKGGSVTFSNVTFADQQTCTLFAQVTDEAGQSASSPTTSVIVDRTAPVIGDLSSPLGKTGTQILLVSTDDVNQDPTDGIQINLQIQVSGMPVGATATVDVVDDNGKTVGSYLFTAKTAIPDKTVGIASFGIVSMPDGKKVKLVFVASDLAGNTAGKTIVAQVLSATAEVRITSPLNPIEGQVCSVAADCGGNHVCANGFCAVPWNKLAGKSVSTLVYGLPTGADVRLCSDAPGLTGADCVSPGFKVVATGKSDAAATDFDVSSLPDGNYRFVAEAGLLPTVPWVSSQASAYTYTKQRTVAIDTVPPVVSALTPPSAAGVPAGCLSNKLQMIADFGLPGGKFSFGVTTANEEATVALLVDNLPAASGKTVGKSATLAVNIPTEGTVTVSAVATDWVGNIGPELSLDPFNVNTVAPTGDFAAPAKAVLAAGDSLDIKIVSNDSDVQGQIVKLLDGGLDQGARPFDSGLVVFTNALYAVLTDGGHTLQAVLTDTCGNTSTIATVPTSITVDTQGPQLLISKPGEGAVFTDDQDAAPAIGGYQVDALFATVDAVSWTLDLGYDCDATFANCVGFQTVSSGNVTNAGGNEPDVLMTIPFGDTPNYSARLTALDNHGNTTVATRGFKVQLSGCLVQLKGLPQSGGFNTQNCAVPGQNCASITVPVSASFVGPCGTVTAVELHKNGTLVTSKAPTGFGAAFDLVLADGDKVDVEAVVLASGVQKGSSGALQVSADLTNPVVAFTAGPVLGVATPASGATALYGKAQDLTPAPGHQLHAQLQVSDAGLAGGQLVKLERSTGGAPTTLAQQNLTLPVALSGTSQTIDIQFATLAEDATNVVTATVQDAAGNIGTATFTASIDWTPPAAVVLNPFAAGDLNPRRPLARLSFTAVGDNGTVGTASSYDVRYSRKPIATAADFAAACDAKLVALAKVPAPAASGSAEQVTIEGPDLRTSADPCQFVPIVKYDPTVDNGDRKYYFAVQVTDPAGNKSPVSAALSTDGLRLRYIRMSQGGSFALPTDAGGNPLCSSTAGTTCDMKQNVTAVGDLDGDGLADLAVGGGLSQPLCIIYGRVGAADGSLTDIDLSAMSGPKHICLPNPGGLGAPTAMGRDVNGDGVTDLIVGLGTGTGGPRSVQVYLGNKNAQISSTPVVVINNLGSLLSVGAYRITTIGNFNGDVSPSGLPISDIAITSRPLLLGGVNIADDRVYIIPGSAAWTQGKTVTIDVRSAADRTANNVATVHLASITGTQIFGIGLLGLGNVLVDGDGTGKQYDELAIAQNATPQQVVILKGRPLSGDTDIQLSANNTGIANDAEAVRFLPDGTISNNAIGFFMAAVEFDGDPAPDLVVQHQSSSGIGGLYWLRGKSFTGKEGKTLSANGGSLPLAGDANTSVAAPGPGAPGIGYYGRTWHMGVFSLGNFADRPGANHTDIVYGRPQYAPNGSNLVSIRLGLQRPASPIPNETAFEYDDLVIGDPFKGADANWGVMKSTIWGGVILAPVGDFNGDGLVDLAIGSVDGSLVIVY